MLGSLMMCFRMALDALWFLAKEELRLINFWRTGKGRSHGYQNIYHELNVTQYMLFGR
jgi:hypothetical protein